MYIANLNRLCTSAGIAMAVLAGSAQAECGESSRTSLPDCVYANKWNNGKSASVTNHCWDAVVVKLDRKGAPDWTWTLSGRGGSESESGSKTIRGIYCCYDTSNCGQTVAMSTEHECKEYFNKSPFKNSNLYQYCYSPDFTGRDSRTCEMSTICDDAEGRSRHGYWGLNITLPKERFANVHYCDRWPEEPWLQDGPCS